MKSLLAVAAASAAFFAADASAQNFSLNPNFGSVSLTAGFTPDPYTVQILSGGNIDSSMTIGGNCRGTITDAPDFRLNYQAGSFDLFFSAISGGDTTLIINAPDGSWHCDDDSGGNLNPAIQFYGPMSGQYDIWIGSYSGGNHNATLRISELGF
ncbi:peptidase S1 [Hyphobacterium sp. SN044]|uniref:peptidase S1 n=1 Tax=Hyphobacterium sp. SN044 TaxID=2912575 RepID=UPI001F1E0DDD|nr:peptidase S1 [Hyphobacterium sp. SN044]MCF8878210.1 peptidase S1 [Hyphobacterium sp. SN044]